MGSTKSGQSAAWFDKFLAHGQVHMGQIVKWRCTTRGLENSIELWMEKIRQAVTEIWVPQVWQPPAGHPPPSYAPVLWQQYNALIVGIHHKIPKLFPDFSISTNFF